MTTIGFIGAGRIGSQLARLAVRHGYDVVLANSRGPESLAPLIEELGPSARSATAEEAAEAGDLVVVSLPVRAIGDVPAAPLAGKAVIDTGNYYPQRDGVIAELEDESLTVAELLQRHAPRSHVVKAFNHITAPDLTADASPAATPGRRALTVAGNDDTARARVAAFIDDIGFDVVDLGPLAEGWRVQRDTPVYGVRLDADGVCAAVAAAKRHLHI